MACSKIRAPCTFFITKMPDAPGRCLETVFCCARSSGKSTKYIESFYGSPPNFPLTRNRRFQNQRSPGRISRNTMTLDTTPSPTSSIDRPLHTRKHIDTLVFQLYPSLCRAAMKRSLNKIAVFWGGVDRRISLSSSLFLGRLSVATNSFPDGN